MEVHISKSLAAISQRHGHGHKCPWKLTAGSLRLEMMWLVSCGPCGVAIWSTMRVEMDMTTATTGLADGKNFFRQL